MALAFAGLRSRLNSHQPQITGGSTDELDPCMGVEGAGQPLDHHEFDPGPLGAEEVEIAVEYCGICHSDVSMLDNEWGMTTYPLVPGHEAVGRSLAWASTPRGLRSVSEWALAGTPSAVCIIIPASLGISTCARTSKAQS
jgi:hypothetical protein